MVMPAIKTFDPSQVTGNYLAAREVTANREAKNLSTQNALADRSRKIAIEDEDRAMKMQDREYEQRMNRIKEDDAWRKQGEEMTAMIDPDADDATFQEQVSKIPDAMGMRMKDLGYSDEEIRKTVSRIFQSGAWSKQGIKMLQTKLGLRPKPSTTTSQLPADAKMVEYLTSNKIAKDKNEAYKMVQMSKSDPVKLVSDMVRAAETAQTASGLMPGDDGYKDRATLIQDAKETVKDIRMSFTRAEGEPLPASTHISGGADTMMAPTPGLQPQPKPVQAPATTGSEPVPQTQEEFDALPPGTVYRDPDDNKLYRK